MIDNTSSVLSQHTFAVGIVDHSHGAVAFSDGHNLGQFGNVPVHAKDTVGDDQHPPSVNALKH